MLYSRNRARVGISTHNLIHVNPRQHCHLPENCCSSTWNSFCLLLFRCISITILPHLLNSPNLAAWLAAHYYTPNFGFYFHCLVSFPLLHTSLAGHRVSNIGCLSRINANLTHHCRSFPTAGWWMLNDHWRLWKIVDEPPTNLFWAPHFWQTLKRLPAPALAPP